MPPIQLNNTVLHHRCHSPVCTVARLQLLVVRFPTMSRNTCSSKRVRRALDPVEPPVQGELGAPALGGTLTTQFHLKLSRLLLPLSKKTASYLKDSVRTAQQTHSVSVIKTSQLMLYSEIIAVCSQIHIKHINTLWGQNVECRTYRAVNTLRLSYKNQPVNAER